MTALALHRLRIEPTWRSVQVKADVRQAGSRPTPLTVVGGTITPAQAEGIERHLEATKGARLAAGMLAAGSTEAGIAWLLSDT